MNLNVNEYTLKFNYIDDLENKVALIKQASDLQTSCFKAMLHEAGIPFESGGNLISVAIEHLTPAQKEAWLKLKSYAPIWDSALAYLGVTVVNPINN